MTAETLAGKIEAECPVGPFKEKWINPIDGRISCVFENLGVEYNGKVINFCLDVYCEKVKRQYMALSIRFGKGFDKKKVLSAIEPLLACKGFKLGKLTERSHWRLMLNDLALSPDELVAKTKEIVAFLGRKRSAIEEALQGID